MRFFSQRPSRFALFSFVFGIVAGAAPCASADNASVLVLENAAEELNVGAENIRYFLDEGRMLTTSDIADMPDGAWRGADDPLYFGYTEANVWLWMSLESRLDEEIHLTEQYGIDQFDVWVLEEGRRPSFRGRSGWAPVDERVPTTSLTAFSAVSLGSGTTGRIDILVRCRSTSSMVPRFVLMPNAALLRASRSAWLAQGLAVGVSCLMLVFSLVILTAAPTRGHLTFLGFILIMTIGLAYLSGFGPLVLWARVPLVTIYVSHVVFQLIIIMSVRFFRSILLLSDHKWYEKSLIILERTLIATVVLVLILPHRLGYAVGNLVMTVSLVITLALLVVAVFLRLRISVYLLVGWSILVLTGLYLNLQYAGFFPRMGFFYNDGHLLTVAMLIQNGILGASIVAQSEFNRSDERTLRLDAEQRMEEARDRLVQDDRMDGLASLVSVISHEMASPLGYSRLLGSEIGSRVQSFEYDFERGEAGTKELKEFMEFAQESGRLISHTLKDASDIMDGFKTVAADEATTRIRIIDIGAYFNQLSWIISPRVRRSPHSIEFNIETNRMIRTIPGYLAQIVTNLVNNALFHAFRDGESGSIVLTVRDDGADAVEILVRDNGVGISDGDRARIFDMYFTTAEGQGGTGIGLGVSHHLAQTRLGGSLELLSSDDLGSAFRLRIRNLEEQKTV